MNTSHKYPLLLLVVFASLGLIALPFFLHEPAAARTGQPVAAAPGDPIILEGPTVLIPPYTTQCASYWYRYTNNRGQYAYLTLNVNDPTKSYNKAEWRTTLPEIAVYRIEAYIPPHEPLFWDCVTDYTTVGDTLTARYEIDLLDQTVSVTVNQAANAGKWVSLGEYLLSETPGAVVRVSDVTSEPNYQRTVSVSALRLTKVAPGFSSKFPMTLDDSFALRGVYLLNGQIKDDFENVLQRFDMEEMANLSINGYNDAPLVREADLTWMVDGPCDSLDLSIEEVRQVESGNWQKNLRMPVPPCTGAYTMTLAVSYEDRKVTVQTPISVDPGTRMGTMQQQGFDKCEISSISNMQEWWNESPYFAVNLYIGGMNRACRNLLLTRDWVKQVQAQGWSFIPTWVGRQAPCMTRDLDKISTDPAVAYAEGKEEAAEAAKVTSKLGLFESRTQNSVVYLDIEGYRYSADYTPECRTATNSFVSGWVDGMHAAGLLAGVYGGVCSSYMADWAVLPNPPDAVWGAYWNLDPVYNPEETVWGWACVKDTMWPDQQRVSQYAGDHPETWGTVTLGGIDSNAIDAILPAPRKIQEPMPMAGNAALASTPVTFQGVPVSDFLPTGPGQGWLLTSGAVLWTADGGQTWASAALPAENEVEAYSTGSSGWAALSGAASGFVHWEAGTGGYTWRLAQSRAELPGRPPYADLTTLKGVDLAASADLPAGAAALRAAPDGTLWVHTANGDCQGVKGTADFTCAMTYALWESRDGGQTWTSVRLP